MSAKKHFWNGKMDFFNLNMVNMYENKVNTTFKIIFKSESEQNILCRTKKDHKCHKQVTLKRDTSFYSSQF